MGIKIEQKSIVGGRYIVDSLGRVYDTIFKNFMQPKERFGEIGFCLRVGERPDERKFKFYRVSSVLGLAFFGSRFVRHKDGDLSNNRLDNLEHDKAIERLHSRQAYALERFKKSWQKLTEEDLKQIVDGPIAQDAAIRLRRIAQARERDAENRGRSKNPKEPVKPKVEPKIAAPKPDPKVSLAGLVARRKGKTG